MTYDAPATGQPDPMVLSSITDDVVSAAQWAGGTGGSTVIGTINAAIFAPVRLTGRHTYNKAWWLNGATANGNVDVGIYTLSGTTLTRVVASTAEAQGTVSTLQVAAAFTPTTIGPGLYYLAISVTSATATFWRASLGSAANMRVAGTFYATSVSPLPTSCTAAVAAKVIVPVFGFSESATI